ncbi:hypothetical protein PACTADRAFT_74549 [Pachysolen tannophilus NRRL Y-2460]|uniref:AAA+ ATPase domain-containing protein n=1 Tax=Pachysolen tannophilus NRRL Y-2460 TaxID=669874 RepID=A0A1E4TYZ0_PACTA|nr:hypothetical protein PACTADRAFT_74549 [Pachysolen tannophilus NRRL Y-2460]
MLKQHLDDYIVGQETTKKIISVAVYKHQYIQQLTAIDKKYKMRLHQFNSSLASLESYDTELMIEEPDLEKSNILLIGPSGSGKTLIAKTLAKLLKLPITITDCTSLTQAGYVGEDIESCIEKLLINANYDVDLCERGIVVLDEIDKLSKPSLYSGTKDIAGEGVQQGLLKLIEGSKVSVKVKDYANIKGVLNDSTNTDNSKKNGNEQNFIVDTSNILFISMGAFIGLDKIVAQRFRSSSAIGFDDDDHNNNKIDSKKTSIVEHVVLSNGKSLSALELTSPVDLQQFGLIPELIGRLPIITALNPLSVENLVEISTEPKNSIIKQYEYFFQKMGVRLAITNKAIEKIAKISLLNGSGARGLRSILEKILLSVNYDCPGSGISFVLIDKQVLYNFEKNDGLIINTDHTETQIQNSISAKYYSRGDIFTFLNDVGQEDEQLMKKIEQEYKIPSLTQHKKVEKINASG